MDRISQGLSYEVYRKFPNFNPIAREKLKRQLFSDYIRINRKEIKKETEELYHKLKDRYQDEANKTYLFELDCWHWARYVENVLKHGYPGDEIVYNEQRDIYMTAPLGFTMLWDKFLFYFSAFLYKIFSLFKETPLFRFLFGLPLFFITIFVVTLFYFSFSFSSYIGAITTCLFVGLAPIFIPRSCAGWFDKDILNLLFPLLTVWCYSLAVVNNIFSKKFVLVILSSFWTGLFCFNWTHWWFVFFIIIIYGIFSSCFYSLRYLYKKDSSSQIKNHLFCLAVYLISSILWILILCSTLPLKKLFQQLKLAVVLNIPLVGSIWPNVYSTVGELRTSGFLEIAKLMGGELIFISSIFCLSSIFVRNLIDTQYKGFKRELIIILGIWFLAMLFASMRGVRFTVFLLIPLGVSLGWMLNDAYSYFKNRAKSWWLIFWVIVAFLGLNISFIQQGYRVAQSLYPLMDDAWYKVLNLIREKTPSGTIVNSWWDFGDWFKVVARRRVIFDGQSQDTPQAYWMAKVLLSKDEEEAVSILRMLNNAGNKAYEIINDYLKEPLKSILLLESVLRLPSQEREAILRNYLPLYAVRQIMEILSLPPTNACFIVEYSMLPKMPAISYLGSWNFIKAYIAQNINRLERERIIEYLKDLGHNLDLIQLFYQEAFLIKPANLDDWLSDKYYFYSNLEGSVLKDEKVSFSNGFVYEPKENRLTSNFGQIPRSLFVLKEDRFQEYVFSQPNVKFSVFIIPESDERYFCFLADRELADSLFVRLYFLKGKGLKHFLPFIDAQEGENYIRVFNIIW
ncbi:MAG: dolichyl-diphosphooligosaccharide--protein glycosyltransferase subunit STT3 [Candidatus Omnitrophica bacterium]|nr:dolichyl-diphosphooligosaccharide--protein glycosyltransferase subunit STT3 [Candidatus Omnitrophota bacterium]